MSIPCVRQSICLRCEDRRQQGGISLVVLLMLAVMLFMGRGLVCFLQQGAENSYYLRQGMQLRLVAESMVEKQWLSLKEDGSKLQQLRANEMILLDKGIYEGLDYTVYARSWGGEIYIIATAFSRKTAIDELIEPHLMVKGVLGWEAGHYVWKGWAP